MKDDIKTEKDVNKKFTKFNIKESFYSNGLRMQVSNFECILDFFQIPKKDDGTTEALRIFVTPVNLKFITQLMVEQLERYEKEFGEIKTE